MAKTPREVLKIGKMKIKSESLPMPTIPQPRMEKFLLGTGNLGGRKKGRRRRFLLHRNEEGMIHYYLWTQPNRGKIFHVVNAFSVVMQLDRARVEKHFLGS